MDAGRERTERMAFGTKALYEHRVRQAHPCDHSRYFYLFVLVFLEWIPLVWEKMYHYRFGELFGFWSPFSCEKVRLFGSCATSRSRKFVTGFRVLGFGAEAKRPGLYVWFGSCSWVRICISYGSFPQLRGRSEVYCRFPNIRICLWMCRQAEGCGGESYQLRTWGQRDCNFGRWYLWCTYSARHCASSGAMAACKTSGG